MFVQLHTIPGVFIGLVQAAISRATGSSARLERSPERSPTDISALVILELPVVEATETLVRPAA